MNGNYSQNAMMHQQAMMGWGWGSGVGSIVGLLIAIVLLIDLILVGLLLWKKVKREKK
jgi:hypothetical protein